MLEVPSPAHATDAKEGVDLAVTPLRMPDMAGLDLIASSKTERLKSPIVMIVTAMVLLVSCVSDPPRAPVAMDPSNPNAPESPPASMTWLAGSPTNTASEEVPMSDAGAVYTCPMHPEVIRSAPGRCPKCGMTLVLRKNPVAAPPAQPPADHQHGTHSAGAGSP